MDVLASCVLADFRTVVDCDAHCWEPAGRTDSFMNITVVHPVHHESSPVVSRSNWPLMRSNRIGALRRRRFPL